MNDSGIAKLSDLVTCQLEIQTKLLALEEGKKKVLIEGNINELDEIIKQQSPLILSCANIENERKEMIEQMGLAEMPFNQLVEQYVSDEGLKTAYADLVSVLQRLKKVNNINKEILQTRITSIKKYMSVLGVQESTITYDKEGHF